MAIAKHPKRKKLAKTKSKKNKEEVEEEKKETDSNDFGLEDKDLKQALKNWGI